MLALQIADSTAYLVVLRIAGRRPERRRCLILLGDEGGYAAGTALTQVLLTGPDQREPDSLPPLPRANGEPVHVPPPAIPAGNQGAYDLGPALGDQEYSRGIRDQTLDVVQAIDPTCVPATRLTP